ncbi:MAG: hypothetical protein ABW043_16655 [Devosia sp.]|uniref:structural cement protein Gp24 n=1 Tax=Devosia sp. TaxID=1871048 RepID=UPI00339595A3
MATYQTDYSVTPAKGLPGQIANEEKCNKVSRTVESSAGIAFGQPAFRGSGDHGVILGGTFAATGAGSAKSGNVGTGTITASPTITAGAKAGRYTAVLTGTSATAPYIVTDPDGVVVGTGNVATANTTIPGITTFTISNAGTMTANDTYFIDVTYTANVKFVGLSVLTEAVPPVASGATLVDGYPQYFTGAFMTMGQMYVTAGASVVDGGDVYWNPSNGRYTSTTTHIRIPDATFDTSGGNGDIVEVSLKLR